jgi:hypothetical protein
MSETSGNGKTNLHEFLVEVSSYLDELARRNRILLDALGKYQALLVSGESHEIERATPPIDRLAGEIRCLDEKRRAYVDDFFNEMGWDGPRNFTAMSDHVKEIGVTDEEAAAFDQASRARMELIRVLAEVDAQNSLNLTLIGQGMSFAEVSLRALLGLDKDPSSYGPSEGEDDGPSLLDAQA